MRGSLAEMKRVSGSWKELEIYLQPIRLESKMNPALPFPGFRQRLEPVTCGGARVTLPLAHLARPAPGGRSFAGYWTLTASTLENPLGEP